MKRRLAKKIAGPPSGPQWVGGYVVYLRQTKRVGVKLPHSINQVIEARRKMGYDGLQMTKQQRQEWIDSQ